MVKFRFCSRYSFTLLIRSFYFLMMVSTDQWHPAIGTFNFHKRVSRCVSFSNNVNSPHFLSVMLHYVVNGANIILAFLYIFIFQLCHGDIESNPGPKRLKSNYLSICHVNLKSISAHNFSKIIQLKAYNLIHKHDLICLSETYLDSSNFNLFGLNNLIILFK